MPKLNIGIEVRDFDLDRMGFSLSVLDESKRRQTSEGYLRMTLQELGVFVDALRAAGEEIDVSAIDVGLNKPPTVQVGPTRPRTTPE